MSFRLLILWCYVFATLPVSELRADEQPAPSFQAILETAGLGREVLGQISVGPAYTDDDWDVLLQVFSRLKQFSRLDFEYPTHRAIPEPWLNDRRDQLGKLVELQGRVVAREPLPLPSELEGLPDQRAIFRCLLEFDAQESSPAATATILTTQVPKAWKNLAELREPVRVRGALVQLAHTDGRVTPVLLTDHIGWYPDANGSAGELLLARHGMDVALLDEVVHRQAFVKPGVTRESDAFYSGLIALGKADRAELRTLCKQNVVRVAEHWKSKQPELLRVHTELELQLRTAEDDTAREALDRKLRRAKSMRGLATTVLRQAEAEQSSVAPMLLQPKDEVGKLYIFEGTARRAVRIPVDDQPAIDAYFELEVFPNESRLLNNQPVVCCVHSIPQGFPQGDQIREPVRIMGVFFKSWRYRSRQLTEQTGEAIRQRQLYTPVVLGVEPTWLTASSTRDGAWAFWGGLAFLGVLALMWIGFAWQNHRDRRARSTLRRAETIDL